MINRIYKWHAGFLVCFVLCLSTQSAAVTLTIWEQEKDEMQQILDKLIAQFQKENNGIQVKRSHFRTEDLRTQYQTAAIGGGGADLVLAPSDFGGPLSTMRIIKPVDDLVKGKDFEPEVLETVKDHNGVTWGYPVFRGNHLLLYYNRSLVKKAPATLDELVKTAKGLTKGKTYGFAYNLNEPFWLVPFLGAYGDRPLVEGKPNIGGPGMVQALTFVKNLKFKDKVVPGDCDYACADTLFVENKVGMIINGDWAIMRYKDALKDNLGMAPLPKNAASGEPMQSMMSGNFLFFNSRIKSAKYEAAQKFAEFLTSMKTQEFFAKEAVRLPVTISGSKSRVIVENPVLKASQEAMAHAQPMPMDVQLRAVWDAMRPQLQGVMAGRTEPKVAAVAMQEDAERRIKQMGQ